MRVTILLAFRYAKRHVCCSLNRRFASTSSNHSSSSTDSLSTSSSNVVTNLVYDKFVDEFDYGPELTVPLVMIHGLFGHKENWRSVAKALQRRLGNTVFTLDLRNHGDSPWTDSMTYEEMAADVRYFLDEVVPSETDGRYTRAHLLGHSMGGKAAMLVALAKGAEQRLESLIVEDIAPIPYDTESHHQFPKFMEAMKKVNMKGSRGEISLELADVVTDVPTRQFLLTNLDRSEEGYRWKCNLSALSSNMHYISSFNMPKGNPTFQRRCLFISGAFSRYVTPESHPLILQKFPKAEFSVIEDAGHWVHADKPYPFMEKVVSFIESV